MMSSVLRNPPEETIGLYPDLVVHDDRVTGSITVGQTRLPLWAFVWNAIVEGWDVVKDSYGLNELNYSSDNLGSFLAHLLDQRGEFARLLLILADVERLDRIRHERGDDRFWDEIPRQRNRVIKQLKRCLKVLEDG
jgi:hypothetical protein